MALSAQVICALSRQIAKCPGFTAQSGQELNLILQEMAQTYDFECNRKTTTINLSTGSGVGIIGQGSGPYPLPADYLRIAKDEAIYMVFGTPYSMINIDLQKFDSLVQQAGISNYPEMFATDTSAQAINTWGAPVMYVWPPSGGNYRPQIRYWSQPADIPNPETSSLIPWFPNSNFLKTRLAGELMKLTDDSRAETYLGDGPGGAAGILTRYLKMQTDDESRAKVVSLDRQLFGKSFNRLPQTKTLGW